MQLTLNPITNLHGRIQLESVCKRKLQCLQVEFEKIKTTELKLGWIFTLIQCFRHKWHLTHTRFGDTVIKSTLWSAQAVRKG